MNATRAGAVLTLLGSLAACAGGPPLDRGASPVSDWSARFLVTAKDLQSSGFRTTYAAVRRIRPALLDRRQSTAVDDAYRGYAVLYVDGRLHGALDLLDLIPIGTIISIQYFSPNEAFFRVGKFHAGGVIAVKTQR